MGLDWPKLSVCINPEKKAKQLSRVERRLLSNKGKGTLVIGLSVTISYLTQLLVLLKAR